MKTYNSRIALRLSDTEKERAEQLIRERRYKNLSQLLRTALTELLRKHQEN
jgi:Arc/MetJ-type ribon-helix-helix transcriptional regulator